MVIFLGTAPSKELTADRSIQPSADVEHNQDDDHGILVGRPLDDLCSYIWTSVLVPR